MERESEIGGNIKERGRRNVERRVLKFWKDERLFQFSNELKKNPINKRRIKSSNLITCSQMATIYSFFVILMLIL